MFNLLKFKNSNSRKIFWSGIIANIIDHYDSSLYAFIAPVIAHLFFPTTDPVVGLIMAYGLTSTSFITRPLGSVFFGRLAARYGPKYALSLSLTGIALFTGLMGLIPTYELAGIVAPILLVVLRLGQGFFAAGENAIAGLYIIENQNKNYLSQTSSIYQSSIIAGNCLASLAATLVIFSSAPEIYFRIPFVIGSLVCLFGFYMRNFIQDNFYIAEQKSYLFDMKYIFSSVYKNRYEVLKVACVSGFSFLTYSLAFIFLNAYLPKISKNIKLDQMLALNTSLMLLDMILLPIIGYIASKFSHVKFMIVSAILIIISIFPIFYILPDLDFTGILFVRLWFVISGIAFTAPIYTWLNDRFSGQDKYMLNGIGYVVGIELFGRHNTAVLLFLWHITGLTYAPAFYIIFINAIAVYALWVGSKKSAKLL